MSVSLNGAPVARVLITTDAVGGIWTYSLNLARGLARHRVETLLVATGPSPSAAQAHEAANVKGLKLIETGLPLDWTAAELDVWNILIASDKMSDQMAYNIVKTLFEKKPELVAVHGEAKNIDLKNQATGSPIPFHPGAKKYLAEQGIKVN